jgi:hypothetical protein
LLGSLTIVGFCSALTMQQCATAKNRRCDGRAKVPEAGTGTKQVMHLVGSTAPIGCNADVRQARGKRHAHLRAGRMQVRIGHAYVRALLHQSRRQRQRQILWQLQLIEIELRGYILIRRPTCQYGKQITLLCQLFL